MDDRKYQDSTVKKIPGDTNASGGISEDQGYDALVPAGPNVPAAVVEGIAKAVAVPAEGFSGGGGRCRGKTNTVDEPGNRVFEILDPFGGPRYVAAAGG